MSNPLTARDVDAGTHVRLYAFADDTRFMDEGVVIGYCAEPTVVIRRADGSTKTWRADMPHEVLGTTS